MENESDPDDSRIGSKAEIDSLYAALRDSKGIDDLCLFAGSLDAGLRSEHAKGSLITFDMLEHGLRVAEVKPLSVLPQNAN